MAQVFKPGGVDSSTATQHDNLTPATYTYDALGRRIKKVVTNSEPFDGTTYFYYNRKWQMVESRDVERDQCGNAKENLDSHVIHGTRYIDEIVRFEENSQDTMFAFQRKKGREKVPGNREYCPSTRDGLNKSS